MTGIAMSTSIFARDCHGNAGPNYAVASMAKERRRTRHTAKYTAFGNQLREWRGRMAVAIAAQRSGIGESTLRLWEGGHVEAPDPLGLVALARIYGLSADEMFGALAAMRGVELPKEHPRSSATTIKGFTAVPVLDDRIAAGSPLIVNEAEVSGEIAFSQRALDRLRVTMPVCVRVGLRERSMWPTIEPGYLVLLDCAEKRRVNPSLDSIYAVSFDHGSALKRVLLTREGFTLLSDNPDKTTFAAIHRPLDDEDETNHVRIVGEAVWWGPEL